MTILYILSSTCQTGTTNKSKDKHISYHVYANTPYATHHSKKMEQLKLHITAIIVLDKDATLVNKVVNISIIQYYIAFCYTHFARKIVRFAHRMTNKSFMVQRVYQLVIIYSFSKQTLFLQLKNWTSNNQDITSITFYLLIEQTKSAFLGAQAPL